MALANPKRSRPKRPSRQSLIIPHGAILTAAILFKVHLNKPKKIKKIKKNKKKMNKFNLIVYEADRNQQSNQMK